MTEQNDNPIPESFNRYGKQIRFPGLGIEAQKKIAQSRAVVIGCGALGSVSSNLLARSGVGQLVLIDRDFVELDNLQRQVIYNEKDVGMPKAVVAEARLREANSTIDITSQVTDVNFQNIEQLLTDEDSRPTVVLDGTDNFETRFLINDACVKHSIPWIYAGCLGAEGQSMTIVPGETPCLHCLMMDGPPPPGTTATCDSGGILSTIINVMSAIQVNEALKILAGLPDKTNRKLSVFDLWNNRMNSIDISSLREKVECPCCKLKSFDWLAGKHGSQPTILCGRNAVQVSYPDRKTVDLSQIATRLQALGDVEANPFLVRFQIEPYTLTIFQDGRAIVNGTEDISVAKKLYAQYVGA